MLGVDYKIETGTARHRNVKFATRVRIHLQEHAQSANVPTKVARMNKFLSTVCAENKVSRLQNIQPAG